MIHGAGDILIHIVPSKTLRKHLLKQKDKAKSVKTGVICITQSTPLMNGIMYYGTPSRTLYRLEEVPATDSQDAIEGRRGCRRNCRGRRQTRRDQPGKHGRERALC